ncbi:TPM domain-containing protein [Flammeovirga yaeyamensis]|uniref:TPM domain-containing protein n=1 Tax=Flammeovirga yaeyamensis TaxID=367791 RepID=A0AAX1MXG7_9BACT|nr:putative membrane protein YgcG [Flammeovirga yaeyamensis]NMF35150.1 TPM domain-containing protein [Flammeovirga yaeyamensis]QWG00030.1 TPM domain-containing protein [Flammeovirga yaeyamensis]
MILISTQDRKAFIATSTKTALKIPNDKVQEIVNAKLLPSLKEEQYSEAILNSIKTFEDKTNTNESSDVSYYLGIIIIGLLIIYILYDFYKLDGFKRNKDRIKFSVNAKKGSAGTWSSSGGSSGGSTGGGFSGGGAGGSF